MPTDSPRLVWKQVELRREATVYPNKWREIRVLSVFMHTVTAVVLVPEGEPVVKKPKESGYEH